MELKDFKTISILCTVSKAFERIVVDQISVYLENCGILDPHQFVYRRRLSTHTALIRVLDNIQYTADRRLVTIAVFFDLTKVFENIDHCILINKLKDFGFSCFILEWLSSYLKNRTQIVGLCLT